MAILRSIVSTFARLADLPLAIEGHEFERLEHPVSTEFTRVTTIVRLRGGGEEGLGEDVVYSAEDHERFRGPGSELPLAGEWTIGSFSAHLDGLELFPTPPEMEAFRDYRRWGFESAALDLALRQAGESLAEALGRTAQPVRFVVSMRLGWEQSSIAPLRRVLDAHPGTRFKLDPVPDWTPELIDGLAALGVVDSVDLKGQYTGTVVDNPANPALYRLVAEGFPEAWIEDPALTAETEPVLLPHRERITWDAPIHSVADIEELPFPPRMINIKPSRFGSLNRLLDAYDYCTRGAIGMYGGGQFELGVGRGQIQYLASLFHPDTPNDVAPGEFNLAPTKPGLPTSPLAPAPAPAGFRWG
jgi:L-alanine-DL-glutamate epimerase-like enolase superfamily enzyme